MRENIGMGSNKTWHGHPDGSSDWAPLSAMMNDNQSGEVSDGGKTTLEAKQMCTPDTVDQVFGQAVVASFIHRNRHPEQNALIPAVGLEGLDGNVMAVLYDCNTDRAFNIHPQQWFDVDNRC